MRHRFGTKEQKAEKVLFWCLLTKPNLPDIGFTIPAIATGRKANPITFGDVVSEYIRYYREDKKDLHKWSNREKPYFI